MGNLYTCGDITAVANEQSRRDGSMGLYPSKTVGKHILAVSFDAPVTTSITSTIPYDAFIHIAMGNTTRPVDQGGW